LEFFLLYSEISTFDLALLSLLRVWIPESINKEDILMESGVANAYSGKGKWEERVKKEDNTQKRSIFLNSKYVLLNLYELFYYYG
jgi:hypothetical protein